MVEGIVASGSSDGTVRTWNGLSSTKTREFKTDTSINSLALSPDGTLLSSGAWRRWNVWHVGQNRLLVQSDDDSYSAVAFSPTGNALATGTENGIVMVFDRPYAPLAGNALTLDKRKRDRPGVISEATAIWSLAFSPDGRSLAALGEISDLILWEVLTGKQRRRLNTEEAIGFSVAFAPNPNILATGEGWGFHVKGRPDGYLTTGTTGKKDPNCARLWDIRTGKPICRLEGHKQGTRCVAFSDDGKLLATGSEDKTAVVWDVSAFTKDILRNGAEEPIGHLESHWMNLAGDNAVLAFDSILAMTASPKQSIPFLRAKLRPAPAVDKGTAEKLLKDLDNDEFRTRQHASEELSKLGEGAEPILRNELSKDISAEARVRIEGLIEKWKGHNPPPEILGALRAVETLERIGSDDSVAVLESLAKGVPWARQTQDAKASLERIRERRK
jgi:WD40 repeat protein